MDERHPEYQSFLDDVARRLGGLKDPLNAFFLLFLRTFFSPPRLFAEATRNLYRASAVKNGEPTTVNIIVHDPVPGYDRDLTFMPTELLLHSGSDKDGRPSDAVRWELNYGGADCELQFIQGWPFEGPPDQTIKSGTTILKLRKDLQPSAYKYKITKVGGTPYEWPGGAHCPEVIIR